MSKNGVVCCVASEARLAGAGETYWDPRQSFAADHWKELIAVFGSVKLLARTRITEEPPNGTPFPKPVSVGKFPYYIGPLQALSKFPALVWTARAWAREADVCVLRVPGLLPSVLWFWLRRYRKPYAVEVLGDPVQVFEVIEHPLRRVWRELYSRTLKAMIQSADATMYVSKTLSKLYPVRGGSGSVISDVRLPESAFTEARSFPEVPQPLRLVHVGNMEQPYKGHEYLLKAVALCKREGFPVQLTLAGDGRLRGTFEKLAEELGIREEVAFRGAVPWGPELFKLLDASDLFVLCSLTEGLPKALLEAMARGLPAIGTKVGGIPEVLQEDTLVDPRDEVALAALIRAVGSDSQRLATLSRRNFEIALGYKEIVLSEARIAFYTSLKNAAEQSSRRKPRSGKL